MRQSFSSLEEKEMVAGVRARGPEAEEALVPMDLVSRMTFSVGTYFCAKCLTQVVKAKYGWIPAVIGCLKVAGLGALGAAHMEHEGFKETGKRMAMAAVLGGASALVGTHIVVPLSAAYLVASLVNTYEMHKVDSLVYLAIDYFDTWLVG